MASEPAAPAPRPDDSLAVLTSSFAAELGAETALLVRWDPEKQLAVPLSQSGLAFDLERHDFRLRMGLPGRALDAKSPFFEELTPGEPHGIDAALGVRRIRYGLGTPVRSPMGLRGSLSAGFSNPPDGHARLLLEAAASYGAMAGLCLDRSSLLLRRLLVAARYDDLTGLLNYASLGEVLTQEVERSQRHHGPLSCCFADLDKFKEINDRNGHTNGNKVLACVGAAIADCTRGTDRAARYGGDEFVLVLPETPWRDAMVLAARLQTAIHDRTLRETGEAVDASVGISQWVEGWSPETLLADADRALLAAKTRPGHVMVSPLASSPS